MGWAGVELEGEWLSICATYNTAFVAAIKDAIPAPDRQWNPDEKVWRVRVTHSFKIAEILGKTHDRVRWYYRTEDQGKTPEEQALATMYLRIGAPPGLIDVAYRFLAKHWHPDLAGEDKQVEATDRMATLNMAYGLLRKTKEK